MSVTRRIEDSPETRHSILIMTANGTVATNEEATVYIKDLDIFLCVKVVDDSLAVLSFGMLRETMG